MEKLYTNVVKLSLGGLLLTGCGATNNLFGNAYPSGWDSQEGAEVVDTDCLKVSAAGPCAEYSATFRQCEGSYPSDDHGPSLKTPTNCVDITIRYDPLSFPGDLAPGKWVYPEQGEYPRPAA